MNNGEFYAAIQQSEDLEFASRLQEMEMQGYREEEELFETITMQGLSNTPPPFEFIYFQGPAK